ncbi:hypothetical protein B0J12DRAFT_330404 [Macrophomina phaseolina]|uniref:Uncharacterized protein n=1 Tax=Macrophomina phaseolina TaxID=35725 RepID=A0ABQ8GL41_9PEZI|nr:hypothetical protein B0J12DRAFT_330404 [Macrophomina phaseolina]
MVVVESKVAPGSAAWLAVPQIVRYCGGKGGVSWAEVRSHYSSGDVAAVIGCAACRGKWESFLMSIPFLFRQLSAKEFLRAAAVSGGEAIFFPAPAAAFPPEARTGQATRRHPRPGRADLLTAPEAAGGWRSWALLCLHSAGERACAQLTYPVRVAWLRKIVRVEKLSASSTGKKAWLSFDLPPPSIRTRLGSSSATPVVGGKTAEIGGNRRRARRVCDSRRSE